MEIIGKVTIYNKPVYSASVSDFTNLTNLEMPTSWSVILLVADATSIDPELIYAAASRLIERGAIFVCTWGPDCERVHDIFDEADVGDGNSDPDDFIMTTWHTDDSLLEVVEFFLTCAFPLDWHLDECSWVAVTIGDSTPASSVEKAIRLGLN